MAYRLIQVGTGGQGAHWCENVLPPNVDDGLIEVVGAVDFDPQALLADAERAAGADLGLR